MSDAAPGGRGGLKLGGFSQGGPGIHPRLCCAVCSRISNEVRLFRRGQLRLALCQAHAPKTKVTPDVPAVEPA